MRWYSCLYSLLVALFLFGLGVLSLLSGHARLELQMLPWQEPAVSYWLLFGGLAGMLAVFVAWRYRFQWLLVGWTLAVFAVASYGYFLSRYGFWSVSEFWNAVWFCLLTLLATVTAWPRKSCCGS